MTSESTISVATTSRAARPSAVQAALSPLVDWKDLEPKWQELERRSDCSFFQSWSWIGSWLAAMPATSDLYYVEVMDRGHRIGLAVIGRSTIRRRIFVWSRTISMNESGRSEWDRGAIEYNAPLAEQGRERDVLLAVIDVLLARGWDELRCSGIDERGYRMLQEYCSATGLNLVLRDAVQSYLVDLQSVRATKEGYLSLLSANTRQQIRHSLKGYEHRGKLAISVARSLDEALSFFSSLCPLHQARWHGKSEQGAFGTAFSRRFHQHLVRAAFSKGELQMARIQAGDEVIGYLYNFVRNGHVYFYQNGFDYAAAGKLKPGHVAHYMAINYNAEAGHRTYDFLSGKQRYKRSLAGKEVTLYWATLQKRRALFALETVVRRALGRTDVQEAGVDR